MGPIRHSDCGRHAQRQLVLLATMLLLLAAPDFAAEQGPSAAQQNPASAESQDAAAKAAARKKRFEEEKQRIEDTANSGSHAGAEAGQTLFVSPAVVNMVLGDVQSFSAFDIDGRTLTHSAQWSVNNSSVAELSTNGDPTITSKGRGTVTVRAQIGERYAEAKVTVISGNGLAIGAVRWSSGDIPGFKTKKIMPAVPVANGPDVFEVAENAQGATLLRALASDGRQLWMRYLSKGQSPDSVPGMPATSAPH